MLTAVAKVFSTVHVCHNVCIFNGCCVIGWL